MGDVIVTFKIMPRDGSVNKDILEEKVRTLIRPQRISRQPIAFGLEAIIATLLVPEIEGEMERIESLIRSIPEVGEIEVTEVNRSI